jgi:hypothetical protein
MSGPLSVDIEGWPTVEGDLDLQTTCTMNAVVESGDWIVDLQCEDPSDQSARPLQVRASAPEGTDLVEVSAAQVTIDFYYDAAFGFDFVPWMRIADEDGRLLFAVVDARDQQLESTRARVFPEGDVSVVDMGCVLPPDSLQEVLVAIGVKVTIDGQVEVLVPGEPVTFAEYAVEVYGAVTTETCQLACSWVQFAVFPLPG